MAMLAPRDPNVQRIGCRSARAALLNEAGDICGAMALQRTNLDEIDTLDETGDELRVRLLRVLKNQRHAIGSGDRVLAAALNQVAVDLLQQIDKLDDMEDGEPLDAAKRHNWEAAQSGRRLMGMAEKPKFRDLNWDEFDERYCNPALNGY